MRQFSLNIHGKLVEFGERPLVAGILNMSPESFHTPEKKGNGVSGLAHTVRQHIREGADILDLGGCSTRPGLPSVSEEEELKRVRQGLEIIRQEAGDRALVSIDTFRSSVARMAVEEFGADIINDISGGLMDSDMLATVASLHVPYILMHMRGNPENMQQLCEYPQGVTGGVLAELAERVADAELAGICDIIIDPGFGFAKTLAQNWELMANLQLLDVLHRPVLVGVSRKSMITKALSIETKDALNASTALHSYALDRGADILRVHDVRAAREAADLYALLNQHNN
ncbi:MAG: dihydropteroate synthase [Muribaculaceae bacterium]|nr:dihydropteroate synthase [Muribaculaceae bacterium]